MNTILDSREKIAELDISNVLGSVEELPKQISHAFEDAQNVRIPETYQEIENCVFVGMGGSALGARIIHPVYNSQMPIPFEIINNYSLPAYTGEKTLVILSSYSGTTEEVLNAAHEAIKSNAKVISISAGGELEEIAHNHHWPHYHINATFNPSNQPRMAIGYAIVGQLVLLSKLNLVTLTQPELDQIISLLQEKAAVLKPENTDGNQAKTLARAVENKIIFLVSADHLKGAVHVFNNQLNENAKHLTQELFVPEMNHHYLEALSHPAEAKNQVMFIFFQSTLYQPRNQKRIEITQKVVEENGYQSITLTAEGESALAQSFNIVQLGAFTNFYLSMLHGLDPAPIPWVNFFKDKLK